MPLHFGTMPLPVQDDIHVDESGLGYALRMANANHLAFSDIAIEVGSKTRSYLPHCAAKQLAFWFGGNAVQLCQAIQENFKMDGRMVAKFMGKIFFRPYHIRQRSPQICPVCLWQYRRAFVWWDIGLATVCLEHSVRLIDACPTCGRRISWRRPGLLFCQCGSAFPSMAQSGDPPTVEETWLTSKIRNLLCPESAHRIDTFEPALSFLEGVSLDTLLRLIYAFGIRPDGDDRIAPGEMTGTLRTSDAVPVIERAFVRLRRILSDRSTRTSKSAIQKTALLAIFDESTSWRESNLIKALLNLASEYDAADGKRGNRQAHRNMQFDLFT